MVEWFEVLDLEVIVTRPVDACWAATLRLIAMTISIAPPLWFTSLAVGIAGLVLATLGLRGTGCRPTWTL